MTDEEGVADLAALSDGLRAEREQGITIDVAYRFFSTDTRSYILADTPGHERYTRNMFTGASNAHVAVLLVDARAGVLRQTNRHARIAKLLGIKHFVATVNKIDLVDFDQSRFREVEDETPPGRGAARRSRHHRDPDRRQARRQRRAPVRQHTRGTTARRLLEYLESVELSAPQPEPGEVAAARAVGVAATAEQRRRYTGRLSAGTLQVGDSVVSLPCGHHVRRSPWSTPSMTSARLPLRRCRFPSSWPTTSTSAAATSSSAAPTTPSLPVLARELDATVCWFVDSPLRAGDRLALKQGARTVRATVQALHSRLDPETLEELDNPVELVLNDIGEVTLANEFGRGADPYADNRDSGAFILIDETTNDTVGAGTIIEPREVKPGVQTRNDIRWHPSSLDRDHRWSATGQRGATIWFTGLPARASPRSRSLSSGHWSSPARWRICWTATTSGTACRTTSDSRRAIAPRTSAASATSPGCSPTPEWSRWLRWCRR